MRCCCVCSDGSIAGISLKTQILYLVVFIARYLDLFSNPFGSLYNSFMKLLFIGTAAAIVYLMTSKPPICDTCDRKGDSFNVLFLVVPCFVLALIINDYFSPMEVRRHCRAMGGHIPSHPSLTRWLLICRFCGRFRSIWKQLRLYHSSLWYGIQRSHLPLPALTVD